MRSYPISEEAVKEAAKTIAKGHGDLGDLPSELANTVANIYYRFILAIAAMSGQDTALLAPYLPARVRRNPMRAYTDVLTLSSTASIWVEQADRMVPAL